MAITSWKLVAACLIVSFLGGALTNLLLNPTRAAASVTREIRANRFVVVGEDGLEYGELNAVRGSGGVLGLWHASNPNGVTAILDGSTLGWDSRAEQYKLSIVSKGKAVLSQP